MKIVEIELAPVVALREPDHLIRCRQNPPVEPVAARLKEGVYSFLENVANFARRGIRDTELRAFVIAGSGNERELYAVPAPFGIGKLAIAALDVITYGRTVSVRRHLQTSDAGAIDINDDPFDHEDLVVSRQGVLPGFELWMPHSGIHQIHLAGAAAVVLKRCDLFRIGGPEQNRPIALDPTGIVGGVAEVLDATGCELRLLPAGDLPNPEVVVADECRTLAIRR